MVACVSVCACICICFSARCALLCLFLLLSCQSTRRKRAFAMAGPKYYHPPALLICCVVGHDRRGKRVGGHWRPSRGIQHTLRSYDSSKNIDAFQVFISTLVIVWKRIECAWNHNAKTHHELVSGSIVLKRIRASSFVM